MSYSGDFHSQIPTMVYEEEHYFEKSNGLSTQNVPESPPPPYESLEHQFSSLTTSDQSNPGQESPPLQSSSKPCVIPQLNSSWKGAFSMPFVRAYPPQYATNGITKEAFVTFIDGLNEAWLANPVLQGASAVGGIVGMIPSSHGETAIAGAVIQGVSGLSSAAISYFRVKSFVKASNETIFHPAGLRVSVLSTKKMCAAVGYPEAKLKLLPREYMDRPIPGRSTSSISGSSSSSVSSSSSLRLGDRLPSSSQQGTAPSLLADPGSDRADQTTRSHTRSLEVLKPYVQPLDFRVQQQQVAAQPNLMKRLGEYQANRMEKKEEKTTSKKRAEGNKKYLKSVKSQEKLQSKMEKDLAKLDRELAKKTREAEQKLSGHKVAREPRERAKVERELEKEKAKIAKEAAKITREGDREISKKSKEGKKEFDKIDKKQQKAANKVYWVVICPWEPTEQQSDSEVEPEDEGEIPVRA